MATLKTDEVTVNGVRIGQADLTVTSEYVETPPSIVGEPVEDWTHTDEAGHEHYYDGGYPTLRPIGPWAAMAFLCRECESETIYPDRVHSSFTRYEPGMVSWGLTVGAELPVGEIVSVKVGGYTGEALVVESDDTSRLVGQSELLPVDA